MQTFDAEKLRLYCDELAVADNVFREIIKRYDYPPFWHREEGFASLVHIILEQQVSLSSALAAFKKLNERLPVITAKTFLELSEQELRDCYFSRQKTIYVTHLAECILSGSLQLQAFSQLSNEEIAGQLLHVKGIGRWTVNIYLMMVLHRNDIFPLNDIALTSSIKHEWQLTHKPGAEALQKISSDWIPYRTIAAYLLWHAYLCRRKK